MDFTAIACSTRNSSLQHRKRQSGAEVVGSAGVSAVLDNTSGTVVVTAREHALAVVELMKSCLYQEERSCGMMLGNGTKPQGKDGYRDIGAVLVTIRDQLVEQCIPLRVFQAQLLSALRHEEGVEQRPCTPDRREGTLPDSQYCGGWRKWPYRLATVWQLHESGLLPLYRLLEANEALPAHYFLGGEDCLGGLIRDMRSLALRAVSGCAGNKNKPEMSPRSRVEVDGGDKDVQSIDAVPEVEAARALLADIARYLLDLTQRQGGSRDMADHRWTGGRQNAESLSSRAAKRGLDQLCCGTDMFGGVAADRTRLQTCRAVLAALTPALASVTRLDPDSTRETFWTFAKAARTGNFSEGSSAGGAAGSLVRIDDLTNAFLARQLRLLVESASGLTTLSGNDINAFEAKMADGGSATKTLVAIMKHFSSSALVESLRSAFRKATALGIDSAGARLHQPLVQWETLAPIVRAAVMAHPQETPGAIALLGAELVEIALNLAPSTEPGSNRMVACDHQQGVKILSVAIKLVAEAETCHQASRIAEGGLYSHWFRSCFGVGTPQPDEGAVQEAAERQPNSHRPDSAQGINVSEERDSCIAQQHRFERLRDAMDKHNGTEVLMDALCWSVPSDPPFVLESHMDVMKTRLRAKFSGRVRDFIDLAVTRLSDLKEQEKRVRHKAAGRGYASEYRNRLIGGLYSRSEDDGDPANREVGFLLRQFKKTGEVPTALKTAILWQPMSWAKIRKILLAPPAERIVMPDDDGNVPPESVLTREAIGSGQGGLRVEVSLKYRRLLVQQLAKDSLLSAKDYENFKKAFTDYLQGQRERETAQRATTEEMQAANSFVRHFSWLESRLEDRSRKKGLHVPKGLASDPSGLTEDDDLSVHGRLAILLQEYLPRALVMEMGMEASANEDFSGAALSPRNAPETAAHENSSHPPPRREWFTKAANLLAGILHEWEQSFRARLLSPDQFSSQHLPVGGQSTSKLRDPSPEEVAEAVLNSVHCCVTAATASLGQDLQIPGDASTAGDPSNFTVLADTHPAGAATQISQVDQSRQRIESLGSAQAAPYSGPRVGQILQLLRKIVIIAVEVDPVGQALVRRCASLLANPNRLDPKQTLSLTYIVASLPPNFHSAVERMLGNVLAKALRASPAKILRESSTCERASLDVLAAAEFGALYLQAIVCLHGRICTHVIHNARSGDAPNGKFASRRTRVSGQKNSDTSLGEDGQNEVYNDADQETTGFAPVGLLDFLWWIERRLFFMHSTNVDEVTASRRKLHSDHLALSRLLRSMVKHPIVEEAYRCALGSPNITMPPLDRLIPLEVAASDEDFCEPFTLLIFLESVTLGQLVTCSAEEADSFGNGNDVGDGCRESNDAAQDSTHGGYSSSKRPQSTRPNIRLVRNTEEIWEACAACLFRDAGFHHAARHKLAKQDYWARAACDAHNVLFKGIKEAANGPSSEGAGYRWVHDTHPAWRHVGITGREVGDGKGFKRRALLDCLLQVMAKLCDVEVTSLSLAEVSLAPPRSDETSDGKVSTFLRIALRLAKESHGVFEGAGASLLVLLACVTVPAISASQGRRAAAGALRILWQEYFCHLRPHGCAAVVSMTRLLLTWCTNHNGAERAAAQYDGRVVVRMLEGLPLLTVEIVRVWPGLAHILEPALDVGKEALSLSSFSGSICFSTLHRFGRRLLQNLVSGTLGHVDKDESSSISQAPTSTLTPRTDVRKTPEAGIRCDDEVRTPLRLVQNNMAGRKRCPQTASQTGPQVAQRAQGSEAKVVDVRNDEDGINPTDKQDAVRRMAAAMPRSCAELIVHVMDAAAVIIATPSRKRHHAGVLSGNETVQAEPDAQGTRASDETAFTSRNAASALTSLSAEETVSHCVRNPSQPPSFTAWTGGLLKQLYGKASEGSSIAPSPLCLLLQALVAFLEDRKALVNVGKSASRPVLGDKRQLIFHSFGSSLVVAIFAFDPSIFTHLVEPPFMISSARYAARSDASVGRSLVILESLKRVAEDATSLTTVRRKVSSGDWLTVVLSHYSVAFHSIPKVEKYGETDASFVPHDGELGVVAFVHRQIKEVSSEELRRLPAAVALRDVDPLLKQYF